MSRCRKVFERGVCTSVSTGNEAKQTKWGSKGLRADLVVGGCFVVALTLRYSTFASLIVGERPRETTHQAERPALTDLPGYPSQSTELLIQNLYNGTKFDRYSKDLIATS